MMLRTQYYWHVKGIVHCVVEFLLYKWKFISFLFLEESNIMSVNQGLSAEQRAVVRRAMAEAGIPGAAVAIVHRGLVVAEGFGYANLAEKTPVTPDSLFPLASVSKSFTATAVMQLVEEGLLSLEEPVVRYVPWFQVADGDASRQITVRMLLNHTSGLGRTRHLDPDAGASYSSRRALVEALVTAKLQTEPGTAWSYSNEGFSTAGFLVDALGSMPFEEHLQQRIFGPLGMNATTPDITRWLHSPNRAFGYARNAAGEPVPVPDLPVAPASLPAGRICSTAPDLARYLTAVMAHAQNPTLKPGSLRQMQSPTSIWGDTGWGYGFGWFIQHGPGGTVVQHGGNQRGVATYLFTVPAEGLGVVVLTNLSGAPAKHLAEELANVTLGRPILRASTGDPLPVVSRYAAVAARVNDCTGSFASALADLQVQAGEGGITISQRLLETGAYGMMETIPIGHDMFMITRGGSEGQPVYALRDAAGLVDRLVMAGTLYVRS
jgi:CubicO group peptidase (beta-lactamase class C family)